MDGHSPVRLSDGGKAGFGYAAVSVDARNPKHLIASTHSLGGKHGYKSDEMFRTTDGGKSWKPIFKTGYEYDYSKAPYTEVAPLHWMFDIEIDLLTPNMPCLPPVSAVGKLSTCRPWNAGNR